MPVLIQENYALISFFRQSFFLYMAVIDIYFHTAAALRVFDLKFAASLIFP